MRLIGGEGKKHLTANNYYWQTQFPALIGKLRLCLAAALLFSLNLALFPSMKAHRIYVCISLSYSTKKKIYIYFKCWRCWMEKKGDWRLCPLCDLIEYFKFDDTDKTAIPETLQLLTLLVIY